MIFEHACKMGLEGIVSKRRDLPAPKRSRSELDQGEKSGKPSGITDRGRSGSVVNLLLMSCFN
jgi:hypothetical protein